MLYYDKIGVSDGIDVNKTSELKEWDIFQIQVINLNEMRETGVIIY